MNQYLMVGLLIAALVTGSYYFGKKVSDNEHEKALTEQTQAILKLEQNLQAKQGRVVVKYVDKIQYIEVPTYEGKDSTDTLSADFRMFYNRATGVPMPTSAPGTYEGPVPVKTVADSIGENFAGCRKNIELIKALHEERLSVSNAFN